MQTKPLIDFNEYLEIEKKLDVRIGTIISSERVPKSKKLLRLIVRFGETSLTVVTNVGEKINPELLVDMTFPFIVNLQPTTIMGIESKAMIVLPVTDAGEVMVFYSENCKLI